MRPDSLILAFKQSPSGPTYLVSGESRTKWRPRSNSVPTYQKHQSKRCQYLPSLVTGRQPNSVLFSRGQTLGVPRITVLPDVPNEHALGHTIASSVYGNTEIPAIEAALNQRTLLQTF